MSAKIKSVTVKNPAAQPEPAVKSTPAVNNVNTNSDDPKPIKETLIELKDLFHEIAIINNLELVEYLLFGFILVGIIIRMFTFNTYSTLTKEQIQAGLTPVGSATGTIWGYSVILFATVGLMFVSANPQKDSMEQIKNIPLSLFAIVILLLWSIVLNLSFYNKINTTAQMPGQYKKWNRWSITAITILSIFTAIEYIINRIQNSKFNGIKSQLRIFSIIVFIAGIITIGIQDTILNNFLVDG